MMVWLHAFDPINTLETVWGARRVNLTERAVAESDVQEAARHHWILKQLAYRCSISFEGTGRMIVKSHGAFWDFN